MNIEFIPLADALGAEAVGINISRPLNPKTVAAIRTGWLEHLVLVFRDAIFEQSELARFGRYFGDLQDNPTWTLGVNASPLPNVTVISNVIVDGKVIGSLGDGELAWHTDMSYIKWPPTASVLHAVEVPPEGGDTYFMNMYRALEALPQSLRTALTGKTLVHDETTSSANTLREGHTAVTDISKASGARHPAICIHPETQRPALFLGRRANSYITGMSVDESENLLNRVWACLDDLGLIYRHRWRVGDVIVWDNRCTMHRRDGFDPNARRIMNRTQVRGDEPAEAP